MARIPVHKLIPILVSKDAPLEVERFDAPAGVDDYGQPLPSTPTILLYRLVAHQLTPKQIERLKLDNARDWRAFYGSQELRTVQEGEPDVVRFQGERWELQEVERYDDLGNIYIAMGKRIEGTV